MRRTGNLYPLFDFQLLRFGGGTVRISSQPLQIQFGSERRTLEGVGNPFVHRFDFLLP